LSYIPTEKDEENSQTAFYFKRNLIKTTPIYSEE